MWPPSDRSPLHPGRLLLALLASTTFLTAQQPPAAPATPAPSPATNTPPLRLNVQREFIPNAGLVARGQLLTASNQLAFLFPPDTKAHSTPALNRVTFVAQDDSYSFVVQLQDGDKTSAPNLTAEAWRAQLATRHPELRELAAFPCHALGTNGPGLDFAWRPAGRQWLHSRAVWLPLPGGHLEVTLLADPAQFEHAQHRLNTFLLTLRRSAPGDKPVAPVVIPD
jgi:hypothetical protein